MTSRALGRHGATRLSAPGYALQLDPEGLARVRLEWPPGRPLFELTLLSSAHAGGRLDELLEAGPPEARAIADGVVEITQEARTTLWPRKRAVLRSYPNRLEYWLELDGRGALDEVCFFEAGTRSELYSDRPSPAGWRRAAREREGWQASRAFYSTVFDPRPNGAFQQYRWFGDSAANGVRDEARLGGSWFFNPAPFAFGLGDPERWAMIGLGCPIDQARFARVTYRGGPGWGLGLDYEGYEMVDGAWRSPTVVILPAADELAGLAAYAAWLRAAGLCPSAEPVGPTWWREPIWCGWGEQVAQAGPLGCAPQDLSSQGTYQAWLEHLAAREVRPGTIVVDDRWMAQLGRPEPHPTRWPDLADFIADRHRAGQRVLLWHDVWALEGPAEPDELISGADGQPARGLFGAPLADPTSPRAERRLRDLMGRLLAPPPRGLGADGLKLDFLHSAPSGSGYRLQRADWGFALLHRLLGLTYRLAKEVNPTALIESSAANPLFRDTADLVRLNDLHTDLRSVVDPMSFRADVARAAGFELVDCDGWPAPSRAALLDYVRVQPRLGIPALYYATRLDQSGEPLADSDYAEIAATWATYRRSL